jgi:hypothetical protein
VKEKTAKRKYAKRGKRQRTKKTGNKVKENKTGTENKTEKSRKKKKSNIIRWESDTVVFFIFATFLWGNRTFLF